LTDRRGTPIYSSWPNQGENWFARIQRDVITRGTFTSTKDLDKKLMRYTLPVQQARRSVEMEVCRPRPPDLVRFIRFN
jgi:hypothetical protein